MNPLQEIQVAVLSTAPEDRLAAVRAALMGAVAILSPVAGAVSMDDLCKAYGVHRATVARKLVRAGVKPAKTIGGRNLYRQAEALKAMEL